MSEHQATAQPASDAPGVAAASGELPAAALRWRCPLEVFDFDTTAQLESAGAPVGQTRAMDALRVGASIAGPRHHIYAMGEPGTGKHTLLRQALERAASARPPPYDWCYVNRFDDLSRPRILKLEAGRGVVLRGDLRALMDELQAAVPAAFESDAYRDGRKQIDRVFVDRGARSFSELQTEAEKHQLGIIATPHGFAIAPMRNGEPLEEEAFRQLPAEQREAAEREMPRLIDLLRQHVERLPEWQRERRQQIRELDRNTIRLAVRGAMSELQAKYRDHAAISAWLTELEHDLLDNAQLFRADEHDRMPAELQAVESGRGRARYEVNVLVDHSGSRGAPIVYEANPGHQNLIGRVDNIVHLGALITDVTMIRSGALQRANGGYLIVDAVRLLSQPYAWEALKRALLAREVRIESLGEMLSLISTVTLEPEPVPLEVKVCIVGPRLLYYLLSQYDEDFAGLFTIVADFSDYIDRTPESLNLYARLVASLARERSMRPLDRSAVARIIEHGARLTGDASRLSMQVRHLADLLAEADHHAQAQHGQIIAGADVEAAIAAQIHRQDRLREETLKQIDSGTMLIRTDGSATAQVNGLSIIDLGSFAFAQPARITATANIGEGEIVDIEREVRLGGAIHSKGVLTLAAFVASRYAPRTPLSLRASLVFEQTYGMVEGDSASLAETCALLSALAQAPVLQSIAVTGSIDQHGNVQAVGGVNEKIEGFFDACRLKELTGRQGVLIPAANVQHLMLRDDVVAAVAAGRFHIYGIRTVDEAIGLLSGAPAGERQADGGYPEGSINARVENRLLNFARHRQEFVQESVDRRRLTQAIRTIGPLRAAVEQGEKQEDMPAADRSTQ